MGLRKSDLEQDIDEGDAFYMQLAVLKFQSMSAQAEQLYQAERPR